MDKCSSAFHLFVFFNLWLVLLLPSSSLSVSSPPPSLRPPPQPECHDDERSALLEFKQSFRYPADAKLQPGKLDSWKLDGERRGNCCSWDGIECDGESGHVIGLDVCCTDLHASINSTSSLFRLVHLRKLNLAYTDFGGSPIPSAIGNLPGLTSLNLMECGFSGQIPEQILGLTNLSSLALSRNSGLTLTSLGDVLQSLVKLEALDLSSVSISSPFTDMPANSSSLQSLILGECRLQGRIPATMFASLPNLQILDMSSNLLSGNIPEFRQGSQLNLLSLRDNDFSGELPASIGNLTQLIDLDLSYNRLSGPIPSFANGSQLTWLVLANNQFNGSLPSSLGNLFKLQFLELRINSLTGRIPTRLSNLSRLVTLDLSSNMLSGTVELNKFLELENLRLLILEFNSLTVVASPNITSASSRYSTELLQLNLASCNLRTFPGILGKLEKLSILDLSSNNIQGEVPVWFQNFGRENLMSLNLSFNSLSGFSGNPAAILSWPKLTYLDLRFNELQGPLPVPPESIIIYHASNNRLSGEISPLLCSRSYIQVLDLSKNSLTGQIPECFSNLTDTLLILSLASNGFYGDIPKLADENCSLRVLDLSRNELEGKLPRSLSSCSGLRFLNIGDNTIGDTFPSWLGAIAGLNILIMRSNRFYGAIADPTAYSGFPALQIIDLSRNNFEGPLPAKYFEGWKDMVAGNAGEGEYADEDVDAPTSLGDMGETDNYDITIMNKGIEMEYAEILDYFEAIDMSSNNFSGEIPNSMANLTGLHLLNLSNNMLSGSIRPFLGGLMNLEALDLSKNRLSNAIPLELTRLTFLEFFDVSGNRLSGPIPTGKQFDTFKSSSYVGNEGLCGAPLSRTCGPSSSPMIERAEEESDDDSIVIEWRGVAVGYLIGFVVAAVISHGIVTARPAWLIRAFAIGGHRRQR